MRIVLSYLTYWAQRSSSPSWGARSLGANGLQRAGQVLSPIHRAGRRDVPSRSAGPRASGLADRLPLVTASRGPGGRLRNVSAAEVSQRSQARPRPLCTAGGDPAGPGDGTRKWSFCTLGGIQQVRALLWHRRAADCLPDAQVGSITLLTIHACLPTWRTRVKPFCSKSSTVALNRKRPCAWRPAVTSEIASTSPVPCQNSRTVSELVVSAISRLLSGTR